MARLTDVNGVVVTARSVGNLIGLSDRRVRQLADEGVIPRTKGGSYELTKAISSYVTYLKTCNDIDTDNLEQAYQKEKMLHERAKRQKAEIILAQIKGEVHESCDIERVMNDMLINFRSKILSLPTKIAPELVGYSDIPLIEEVLEREMYEVLDELSDYSPEKFESEKYIDLDEDILEESIKGGVSDGEEDN